MKQITRRLYRSLFVATACSFILLPLNTYAIETAPGVSVPAGQPVTSSQNTSAFCSVLGSDVSDIDTKLNAAKLNVSEAWTSQTQTITGISSQVDQKIATEQSQADAVRRADFDKLMLKAKTASQTQAVNAYIAAVNNGLLTRRLVYSESMAQYRSGLSKLMNDWQTTVQSQMKQLQGSVATAVSYAQTACAATPDSSVDHSSFITALKNSRLNFLAERKADASIASQVKALAVARNNTNRAADQAYIASLKNAKVILQKSFSGNI